MVCEPRQVAIWIIRTLREKGHEAYLAGGCVRDELLGLHPKDFDVATSATPEEVGRLFRSTRSVGKAFGVMQVRRSGTTVEVATFREDAAYTDKRRPDRVTFSDARMDAQRRDFTINALLIDPLDTLEREGGRIIDYVGGLGDLADKRIRAVGNADERLAEDHLRALRAVRFASRLGFEIEPTTASAIGNHAAKLAGVSRERIGDEVRRMLESPARVEAVRLMHGLGLDGPVLDEHPLGPIELLGVGCGAAGLGYAPALAGWALDRARVERPMAPPEEWIPARVQCWRGALCLSNEEQGGFGAVLFGWSRLGAEWLHWGVAQQKRACAAEWFGAAAGLLGAFDPEAAERILARRDELARTESGINPEPFVTGDDLVEAGIQPGPELGMWLRRLYDEQLEGGVRSREEALSRVLLWSRGGA